MKQALLVFWKDVRHLWRELGVYALVLLCFAVVEPQAKTPGGDQYSLAMFVILLEVLMAASWLVLIAGAIHADNPVGDTQFWLTRPYRWSSLLGAKLLFTMTCVLLPFVVMQWCMVFFAGLNPFASIGGMGVSLAAFVLVAMLPMMLVSCVTESLTSAFLLLAGLLLAWAAILQFVLAHTDMRMSPRYEFAIFGPFFCALMVGVLLFQYAMRNTKRSRMAIVGLLALFLLMHFGFDRGGLGAPIRSLIDMQYPLASSGSLRLVFAPGTIPYDERNEDAEIPRRHAAFVALRLPVHLEGLGREEKIRKEHIAFDVTGANTSYSSAWQDVEVTDDSILFLIPKKVADEFARVPVELHVELSAEKLQFADTRSVVVAEKFPGPRGGVCVLEDRKAICNYAYEHETPTRVLATFQSKTCGTHDVDGDRVAVALLDFPPGTRLDPVIEEPIRLPREICAGDSLAFSEYAVVSHFRVALDIATQGLAEYRVR